MVFRGRPRGRESIAPQGGSPSQAASPQGRPSSENRLPSCLVEYNWSTGFLVVAGARFAALPGVFVSQGEPSHANRKYRLLCAPMVANRSIGNRRQYHSAARGRQGRRHSPILYRRAQRGRRTRTARRSARRSTRMSPPITAATPRPWPRIGAKRESGSALPANGSREGRRSRKR